MSTEGNDASITEETPRKLKILMLHGYTQSGPLFHAKTRALEKALEKAFPPQPLPTIGSKPKPAPPGSLAAYPGGVTLIYPTAPRKLSVADIPGYIPTDSSAAGEHPDFHAWWQRNDNTGEYDGLADGLRSIADAICEAGGVDGVIGFSQGAAAAAMVTSLLETERPAAFSEAESRGGIAYPSSFLSSPQEQTSPPKVMDWDQVQTIIQPPLKFAVSYSGFRAPNPLYASFYSPKISTPMLHVVGTLDSVVEESRSLALAEVCVEQRIVYHPGGHFVPIGREMVVALVGFIRRCCQQESAGNTGQSFRYRV